MFINITKTRTIPVNLISSDRVDEAFDICLEDLNSGTITGKGMEQCLMMELKRMALERNQEELTFPTNFEE
ncbi:unnamed protein product [Rodentolepis nana]|uniref:Sporulation protein n=1 Tax=Rodentolepis nana TaxID=102285 RepID=A0A0R3TCY6_RODNA|nr:unnamed protein product [Rodentolepis nana]